MINFSGVQTIIFDLDNTLFMHDFDLEIQQDAKYLNIKDMESFKKDFGKFWDKLTQYAKNTKMTEELFCKLLEENISAIQKENIASKKVLNAIYKRKPIATYNSTFELLNYFKGKGYKIVALSDWFREDQISNLSHLDIADYFDEVYGWDNSFPKPHKKALKKIIGSDEKSKYIMIGDNLHADIECANRVGIQSIWINLKKVKQDKIKPTLEVSSLSEILEIIK